MLYVKEARGSIEEVCKKIEAAAAENKFGVFAVHDLNARLAAKGVGLKHECRILEVCQPQQAKKVLDADMSIATALPCRIAVYEEGGKVKAATIRPSAMLAMFGNENLKPVACEVETTILRIIDAACA